MVFVRSVMEWRRFQLLTYQPTDALNSGSLFHTKLLTTFTSNMHSVSLKFCQASLVHELHGNTGFSPKSYSLIWPKALKKKVLRKVKVP